MEHVETQHSLWDILVKSDLLNVIILAIAIIYLGNKFLPKIIEQRKNQIKKELEHAHEASLKASEELEEIKKKAKNAEYEIEEIKNDARKTAQMIKKQIQEETEKELEGLKLRVKREITSSQEEAIQDIKQEASETAIKLAEEALIKMTKDESIQKKLVEDFLKEIKNPGKN